jgi:hypothetical protein
MMSRPSLSLIVLVVSAVAIVLGAANLVLLLTRTTTSKEIGDHTIRLVDLSDEVLNAQIRGPQGAAGVVGARGRPGARGKKGSPGLRGVPGVPGTNGTNGTDYGFEIGDLTTRVESLESQMDSICSTQVAVGLLT